MEGSIADIETFSTVDGPGIRTVVFLNGCMLRCKYCHNPEMWTRKENNITANQLVNRIIKNKNYFGKTGGVTFSGGEPLLQPKFLIEVCKKLKKENINIALDTAGVGIGHYEDILKYVDTIILDIKHTGSKDYKELTGHEISASLEFINILNKLNKKVWIRQVIIPGFTDSKEYLDSLLIFLKEVKNIEKIEFLPYHKMGISKYKKLNIKAPYEGLDAMDIKKCNNLYNKFIEEYNNL